MTYNSKISNNYKLLREIRDILKNGEYGTGNSGDNTELLSKLDELEARLDNLVDNDTIYDDSSIRNEISALKADLLRDKLTYVAYADNLRLNDNNGVLEGFNACYTDNGFVRRNKPAYDELIQIYNPKDIIKPFYLEFYAEYSSKNTTFFASGYSGIGFHGTSLNIDNNHKTTIDIPTTGLYGLLFTENSISLFVNNEYITSVDGDIEFTNYDKLGIGYACTLIRDFKVYTLPVNNNTPSESSGVVFKENEYYSCPNPNLHINLKFIDKDTNNPIQGIILQANDMVEYELDDDGSFGWNVRRPLLLNDENSWEGGYGYLYPTGGFQNGNSSDSFSFESQKDAESGEYGLYFDGFGLSNTTDNGYFVGYWKDIGDEVTITVPVDIVGGGKPNQCIIIDKNTGLYQENENGEFVPVQLDEDLIIPLEEMTSVSLEKSCAKRYEYITDASNPDMNDINIFNNILPGDYGLEICSDSSYIITIDGIDYYVNIYINYDEIEPFHIDRNGIIQVKVDHYESQYSPLITASISEVVEA